MSQQVEEMETLSAFAGLGGKATGQERPKALGIAVDLLPEGSWAGSSQALGRKGRGAEETSYRKAGPPRASMSLFVRLAIHKTGSPRGAGLRLVQASLARGCHSEAGGRGAGSHLPGAGDPPNVSGSSLGLRRRLHDLHQPQWSPQPPALPPETLPPSGITLARCHLKAGGEEV